jgi:hypothetical protein
MHVLIKESVVNKEIRKANVDINKICKRFRNVMVLDLSNVSKAYHTRHGQHLNRIGKEYISQEISKIIGNNKKIDTDVIALELTKKIGSCRLQSLQNKPNQSKNLKIIHHSTSDTTKLSYLQHSFKLPLE